MGLKIYKKTEKDLSNGNKIHKDSFSISKVIKKFNYYIEKLWLVRRDERSHVRRQRFLPTN